MAKRAALYARVSTRYGHQDPEVQLMALRQVAERAGWQVVEEYVDHGISGANGRNKRPAFDRLLKDAIRRRFDIIMAWSVDRLGRSLQDFEPRPLEVLDHALGKLAAGIVGGVFSKEPPEQVAAARQGEANREYELGPERAMIHQGCSCSVLRTAVFTQGWRHCQAACIRRNEADSVACDGNLRVRS
jgi:hypothetical protein